MRKGTTNAFAASLLIIGMITVSHDADMSFIEGHISKVNLDKNLSGYHETQYTKLLYKKKRSK